MGILSRLTFLKKLCICFLFILCSFCLVALIVAEKERELENLAAAAQKKSLEEIKKHTHNKIKNLVYEGVNENEKIWVFGYRDLDEEPRPGSGWTVVVNKKDGTIIVYDGM